MLLAPVLLAIAMGSVAMAQPANRAALPAIPAPMGVPVPGPDTGRPYAPQPILPGGIVMPLFLANSPYLKADRLHEPEVYNMERGVPGRISSIVNIHNPSIEMHFTAPGLNTGAAIILIAGGGHTTLNVGYEGADFVPYFFNFGINTIIIRSRLRRDGYDPRTDEVYDVQQAIRLVRAHAAEWGIDPNKIGVMGFSAGAELAMAASLQYDAFDARNNMPGDPLAGISSRPDFVGSIYPGPSLFARGQAYPIPKDAPPAFITSAGWGDQNHATWADEYFAAFLKAGVPNVEMHIYARGQHAGALTYRNFTAFGTWQDRFIAWFRDLGFFAKPGVVTQAALDVEAFKSKPAPAPAAPPVPAPRP
jgi:endo-1,4-beta-xylanase